MIFRTTRIAVTLCLIVATTIQPLAALAFASPCSDTVCESQRMCEGGGCCEIAHSGDRCCCCDSEGMSNSKADASEAVLIVTGRCTCGVSTPPMNRTCPRDELVRELTVRIASLDFTVLTFSEPPVARPRFDDAMPGGRTDFSQRFLCVWRI